MARVKGAAVKKKKPAKSSGTALVQASIDGVNLKDEMAKISSLSKTTTFEKIDNEIVLRIIKLMARTILGSKLRIDFHGANKEKLNNDLMVAMRGHHIYSRLFSAIMMSLIDIKGGAILFVDDKPLDIPIRKIVKVNAFNGSYLNIKEKEDKDIAYIDYHDLDIEFQGTTERMKIDPSRIALIRRENQKETYAMAIDPICTVLSWLPINISRSISNEALLTLKIGASSYTEIMKDASGQQKLNEIASDILKNKTNHGLVSLPSDSDLSNFSLKTNMEKYFEVLINVLSLVSGIPRSMLAGMNQSTLNTGAGKGEDFKNFMREVNSWREGVITPFIVKYVDLVLGEGKDYTVHYDAVYEMSNLEKLQEEKLEAEIKTQEAQRLQSLVLTGIIDDSEARERWLSFEAKYTE